MNTVDSKEVLTPQETITVEVTIQELEDAINKREQLKQLESSPLFKEVILEGYMEKNAIRIVHLKGSSNMQSDEHQKGLDHQIMGIAQLGEYFRAVYSMAAIAEKRLEQYTKELANAGDKL